MSSSQVLSVEAFSASVVDSGKPILRDISFTLSPGETLCIVGESGSGKSVMSLSMMGLLPPGVLKPSAGRIMFDGEDVLSFGPSRLRKMRGARMSMIFQEPMTALNPVQRAGEQVAEVLRVHTNLSRSERRKKVMSMLEAVQLPDVERIYSAYPHELSGGQRQRIAIAMALILKPKLLIADEPTTALDVTTQKQILSLIRELQERHNTAVLFITHDLGVVSEIADRIVVMKEGDVVETGLREEILASPRENYTRALVSSVPSLTPPAPRALQQSTALEVEGLFKSYVDSGLFGTRRRVQAVSDVQLALRRGEILGVVGESGSGKSTVARCITRLIDPTAGRIAIAGVDIATARARAVRPLRQRIQIIFQDPYRSLNPRLRISDSMIEGVVNFGMSRDQARGEAKEMLDMVGLPADSMERFPQQFSGGQRQRICIARALLLKPDILVADEAVSALDVTVQAQVLSLLEKIRAETGTAILFITHDLRVAAKICDTIVVMQNGRVVEVGPTADVLGSPQDDYTKTLIDAAPGRGWDFQNFRPLSPKPALI